MKTIDSNIDGVIAEVKVKVGDTVEIGQEVIAVESMKSIVNIEADVEGTVKEIKVGEGDFINEDDPLIVLE